MAVGRVFDVPTWLAPRVPGFLIGVLNVVLMGVLARRATGSAVVVCLLPLVRTYTAIVMSDLLLVIFAWGVC